MIYQKIILQMAVESFDPVDGFSSEKAARQFYDDMRQVFARAGWHCPQTENYPCAVTVRQHLILSPMGLRGIVKENMIKHLENALDRTASITPLAWSIERNRRTSLTATEYQAYLEQSADGLREEIARRFRMDAENAGKYKTSWMVLDKMAAEMNVSSLSGTSYFEAGKRHVYRIFQEMEQRGELISMLDSQLEIMYRTATKQELEEFQTAQEVRHGSAMEIR